MDKPHHWEGEGPAPKYFGLELPLVISLDRITPLVIWEEEILSMLFSKVPKVRVKGKKLYFGFVDLEKAFDRVPREVIS